MIVERNGKYKVKCNDCGDVTDGGLPTAYCFDPIIYHEASRSLAEQLESWQCGSRDLCPGCAVDRSEE